MKKTKQNAPQGLVIGATADRDPSGGEAGELRAMATHLIRAVDTLGRLPMNADTRPAGARSAWPEMIRDSRFAIEVTRRNTRARPLPAAIDDPDRLAMLMWHLPSHQRQLLWARLWRQMGRIVPPPPTKPNNAEPRSSPCVGSACSGGKCAAGPEICLTNDTK